MSTNGRRAWRKWARTQRGAFGMGFKDVGFCRRHPFRNEAKPIGMKNARPAPRSLNPFTPRSVVGMSESCKKRLARRSDVVRFATTNPAACVFTAKQARALGFRIGERLRPCPGCWECREDYFSYGFFPGGDPREFEPDEECSTEDERAKHAEDCARWKQGEAALPPHSGVEWMPAGMYKRQDGTPSAAGYGFVERSAYGLGTWRKNQGRSCAESGVLPAKLRTARDPGVIPKIRPWAAR